MKRFILCVALAASALSGAAAQTAPITTDEAMEAKVAAVASQLRCVVCQGQALQDSPSELAQQMRALIREQLVAGKSPDEIKSYFVAKYGEWILLEPQPHGFNILAWALPPLLLIGGAILLTVRMRRWAAAAPSESDAAPAPRSPPTAR